MAELEKRFDRAEEQKIYEKWEKSGYFKPETNKGKDKGEFSIIMPPLNANGNAHLGHALMVTIEDILIRYNRMIGKETLWLPGTDHAGFETQVVYEKVLEKEGKTRFDYERDTLYQMIWDFTESNKSNIKNQLRALGSSCDWDREKFTLDKDIIETVYKVFKKMYDEGLIYRGNRIINWDPYHQTGFSELEVAHKERKTNLTYIKYQIKGSNSYITVATTRPETMLGDTAIAVNPEDKRYQSLIGEIVILPIINREIPIIADGAVEMEFGTGAVKVTPAHDPLDFEIGERHNLPAIQVIDKNAKMTAEAGKDYEGLHVKKARAKVVETLESLGLVEKVEEITHNAAVCYKCGRDIEPLLSEQWFIKTKDLAKRAIKAVEDGEIKFVSKRFEKIYFNWMENLKDWNISRQIVCGIRIPAWFCECGEIIVSEGDEPKECPKCKSPKLTRDQDTFDTWFSSAQWPYAALDWPNGKDYKKFYPTDVMETAWDILIFWVARMIMMGIYITDNVPFKTVYIHGLIRDSKGQKMSKSKGNVINPMDIIAGYGTDALRFSLVIGNAPGNDLNFDENKIKGNRNFVTKLWNIARFIQMNAPQAKEVSRETFTIADQWILSELETLKETMTKHIEKYELHLAAEALYDFVWYKFADWYVESSKYYLNDHQTTGNTQGVLRYVLSETLKLSHPFMPFVTEAIWQGLELSDKMLIIEEWPQKEYKRDKAASDEFEIIQGLVAKIRNLGLTKDDSHTIQKKELENISPSHIELIANLARIKKINLS